MPRQPHSPPRRPIGIKLLAAFFAFGLTACTVTIVALVFSGGVLGGVWKLNPQAQAGFQRIGTLWSVLLMTVVGIACAAAAYGLTKGRWWGRRLAIGILIVNLIGDTANAVVRHDPRTLIGLPVGGAMIVYLWLRREEEERVGR